MFERVAGALSSSTPERFYILYGSGVEDVFINRDGVELNIEQALFTELKAQGYERVVFSAPHRPVFFMDEQSSNRTWPSTPPAVRETSGPYRTRVGSGPFGARLLKSHAPAPPVQNFSQLGMGDVFLINFLNTIMRDSERVRSAVVILQAETLFLHFESRRILAGQIGEWARLPSANLNTCVLVFSAAHLDQLQEIAANIPVPEVRNSILNSTTQLRQIGSPDKDEVSHLLKHLLSQNTGGIDTTRLAEMIKTEGGSLRVWLSRFRSSPDINSDIIRSSGWFQAYRDSSIPAAKKLEALVGLKEIKERIAELTLWMESLESRLQSGSPRLHMLFEGNPGTTAAI
jgi:hypothetical protein